MIASENRAMMEGIFSEWSKGNSRPLLEAMADDVVWTVTGSGKWAGTFAGKENVLNDLLRPIGKLFETRFTNTAKRFIADDEHVVVECEGYVITKKGDPYKNKYCFIFRLSGGMLKEVVEYMDTELVTKILED